MKKISIGRLIIYVLLILLTIICFLPFYIMIINATHSSDELMTGLYLLPGTNVAKNYVNMTQMINIGRGFLNSIIVTVSSTVLSAYFGAMTAFGIEKYEFKGKNVIFVAILMSMMIPAQLGIIGFFRLCKYMGMLDTFIPLILPSIANASTVFFIIQYMKSSLPDSLLECARIEGCGEFRIFNSIALPLIKPAIATMSIFNFVSSWNNFMTPMIILLNQKNFTLPILIMNLRGAFNRDFGATYLALALSVLPIMIAYAFMSKSITEGLTVGAVKG